MVIICTNWSSPDLICWDAWNDKVPVRNITAIPIVMKSLCIISSLVVLSCGCLVLEFDTVDTFMV